MNEKPNVLPAPTTSKLPVPAQRAAHWLVPSTAGGMAIAGGVIVAVGAWIPGIALAVLGVAGLGWSFLRSTPAASAPPKTSEDAALLALRRRVSKAKYFTHVATQGERAAAQLTESTERFARFRGTLGKKFAPEELTYDRYLGAALALRDAVYGNLEAAVATLEDLDSIDPKTLGSAPDRAATRTKRLMDAEARLAANDAALSALDEVVVALENLKTRGGAEEIEPLLETLRELADRASKYAVS